MDPRVDDIAPDLSWDLPLRLLAGIHYLVLGGDASWGELDAALEQHAEFLARWCAEQEVQTNEVQRSWGLLPAFLSLADARPFDVLELGPSAGLNLLWDRYRYRYSSGTWGSGVLELTGDDRVPPPAELLGHRVEVVRRRGVDLSPVDVTTEHGARLLQAFVWADQADRLERLRRAIDVVRHDPPELIRGDPASPATDIYSFGCLVYECATGAPPFGGRSLFEVGVAHLGEPPPSPRERRPELGESFAWTILQALEKEPDRRPPTATAYTTMLRVAAR